MEQLQDLSLMSSDPRTIWKELGLSTVEEWWCSKSWQDEPDRSEYCMWWEWPLCYDPLRFISWFFDLFLPFINHSARVHNIHISHICLTTHHTYCTLTSSWLYDYTFFDICFYVVWNMSCLFLVVLRHPILLHFFDFVVTFFSVMHCTLFFFCQTSHIVVIIARLPYITQLNP